MARTQLRVVGSGFTTFNYNGRPIAWLESVQDSGQQSVSDAGQGYEAVTPLGSLHPAEIVTSSVIGAGTLDLAIRELWNQPIWEQLAGLESVGDVAINDVYQALAAQPQAVSCQMIIKPPGTNTWRGRIYHNCCIFAIDDGDRVTVGGMSVAKNIRVAYTHKTPFTQAV